MVGSEAVGPGGISSWYLVCQDSEGGCAARPSWNDAVREYSHMRIFHQVRNPIDTISSLTTIAGESFDIIGRYIPGSQPTSTIKKCMEAWYYWNMRAEKMAEFTYRVEDIENVFENSKIYANKSVNSRNHVTLARDDLIKVDEDLWNKIELLASKYGYGNK